MQIEVNGKQLEVPAGTTGGQLLEQLKVAPATVVVELNGEVLPVSQFLQHAVGDSDRIELVTIVGGG